MEHAIDTLPKQIELGNQGESGILDIDLDCTTWLTDFPTGEILATFLPPDSYTPELLPITQAYVLEDDVTFRVIVMRNMTRYAGKGSLNIRLVIGDDIEKRSAVVGTYVAPSHATATGEMPADVEDWATEATQKLAEIMARMGFVPKGDYNSDTEYKHGDWVSANGGSYGYIWPEPSTGVSLTDTTHWQQIASIGGQDLVDAAVAARDAAQGYKDAAANSAAQLAAGTASPAGTYANLSALNTSNPDHGKIYITLDDGNWCYHNGFAFVAGGVYQAASIVPALFVDVLHATKPDEELVWDSGYVRENGTFVVSTDYWHSKPVKTEAGQTLWIWQGMDTNAHYLAAYNSAGLLVTASSLVGLVGASSHYSYVVPSGIEYITVCCPTVWKGICMVSTTDKVVQSDAYDRLMLYGDVHAIQFAKNVRFDSTKRYPVANTPGNSMITRNPIPIMNLSKAWITEPDSEVRLFLLDEDFTYISTKTINNVNYTYRSFPAAAVYAFIFVSKTGVNVTSVDDVGLHMEFNALSYLESTKYEEDAWDTTTLHGATCISDPGVELMAHVSNVYDGGDGYLYVPYYANHTTHVEGIGADVISKISKVSQCNLNDFTVISHMQKGSVVGSFTQSSTYAPYDPLLIETGADTYNLVFVATPNGGTPSVAVRPFTKSTLVFSDTVTISQFTYTIGIDTYTVPMNVPNLSTFMDRLLSRAAGTSTIGTYPILTQAIEHGGEWYSYLGGLQSQAAETGFAGCIVKTADYGLTWEFVAYNSALSYVPCCWEGAVEFIGDIAYCLLRAVTHGAPYGTGYYQQTLLMSYDLTDGTWGTVQQLNGSPAGLTTYIDPYYEWSIYDHEIAIGTDPSRPFLYVKNGYLYAMVNVTPKLNTTWKPAGVFRSHLRIYKYDSSLNLLEKRSFLNDAGVHYHSAVNANGREYFCFTEDRRHLDNDTKGNISLMVMDFLDF